LLLSFWEGRYLSFRDKRAVEARGEAGIGLMEVIVYSLLALIVGSICLHLARSGYAIYKLNGASSSIANELSKARQMAIQRSQTVNVIFDGESNTFGIDRNGNSRLDYAEAEEMPNEVYLKEGSIISFLPSGSPPAKSGRPNITISNNRGSRHISISSVGSVEIE
jgi:hypothetical protein